MPEHHSWSHHLWERLAREDFDPGLLGLATNPFWLLRRALVERVRAHAPIFRGRVLDVGCGSLPYVKAFTQASAYEGLELGRSAQSRASHWYEGGRFPFSDAAFDGVVSFEVLEHAEEPFATLGEMARVIRPDGLCLLTAALLWEEHEAPHDHSRFTSFGLRRAFESAGFEVLQQEKLCVGLQTLAVLLNSQVHHASLGLRHVPTRLFLRAPLVLFVNLLGICLAPFKGDRSLYVDNLVLARRRD